MSDITAKLNQQRRYGVVRFRGTVQFNTGHALAFESDDPIEAMTEMERLCAEIDTRHGYMLIIK